MAMRKSKNSMQNMKLTFSIKKKVYHADSIRVEQLKISVDENGEATRFNLPFS